MICFAIANRGDPDPVAGLDLQRRAPAAEYDLRSELFGHLMTLSPGYYRDHPTGDVMSRLTNDVQTVRRRCGARGAVHLTNAVTAFGAVLTMMLRLDPVVARAVDHPLPADLHHRPGPLSRRVYRTTREVQAELGTLSSRIQEDLGAIQVIKTYGLEEVRRTGFLAGSQRLLDKNMAAAKVRVQLGPILTHVSGPWASAILILVGGPRDHPPRDGHRLLHQVLGRCSRAWCGRR